jgi:hypothetical protein
MHIYKKYYIIIKHHAGKVYFSHFSQSLFINVFCNWKCTHTQNYYMYSSQHWLYLSVLDISYERACMWLCQVWVVMTSNCHCWAAHIKSVRPHRASRGAKKRERCTFRFIGATKLLPFWKIIAAVLRVIRVWCARPRLWGLRRDHRSLVVSRSPRGW